MWKIIAKNLAKNLVGASLGLLLGTVTAYAASGAGGSTIKFSFEASDGAVHKVDADLGIALDQAAAGDVISAVEADLGSAKWDALTPDDQTRLIEEAVSHVQTKLQNAWAPGHQHWHFAGPRGTFDRKALQRGYQVYREVCASCHGLKYISFRNLSDKGGPEFTEAEVKALAAEFTIIDGPDDAGDMFERPGKPADRLPEPYANDNLGRAANGGALPPDLSLITKARHHGPDYIYSLLNGYDHVVPPLLQVQDGLNYNPYFPGRQIAMPKQLFDGLVTYADESVAATPEQMAKDVTEFLHWAAEPKMEARKSMGAPVLIYLLVLTIFLYMSYKRIWRDVDH